jgi:hypothetical protein
MQIRALLEELYNSDFWSSGENIAIAALLAGPASAWMSMKFYFLTAWICFSLPSNFTHAVLLHIPYK